MQTIHIALISLVAGAICGAGVFFGALGLVEKNYLRWVGLLALFLGGVVVSYVVRYGAPTVELGPGFSGTLKCGPRRQRSAGVD